MESLIIWATQSENVPSSMRNMCGFTSSCACARSHPSLCSPLIHSIVSNESASDSEGPEQTGASAQSVLGRHCPRSQRHIFA